MLVLDSRSPRSGVFSGGCVLLPSPFLLPTRLAGCVFGVFRIQAHFLSAFFFLLLPAHFCALLTHFLSFLALDQARLSLFDGLARCSQGPCFRFFTKSRPHTHFFFLKSRAASAAEVCLGMRRYVSFFPVRANSFWCLSIKEIFEFDCVPLTLSLTSECVLKVSPL